MLTILLKLLNNKYVYILLFVLTSIWMLNSYTNGKVEDAVTDVYNTIEIKVNETIKGDQDAVDKQDNDISSGSILDSMFGPDNSNEGRQERDQGNSNQAPDAYPQIENRLEADGGNGVEMVMPNYSIPEQSNEDYPNPEVLQECTDFETGQIRQDCEY